jgi:hypothetical protein
MDQNWPALPLDEWRETYATLHMWSQVVGKIALACTPRLNHFWNVAFQVTPRGLSTGRLEANGRTFALAFDFVDHQLIIQTSGSDQAILPLRPQSVAAFYKELIERLREIGLHVSIWPVPVEVPNPIRFDQDDRHASYDPAFASAFWRSLVAMTPVFDQFRARFLGKSSPVHFFWGSFDLASTRFSGRPAPPRPGADVITSESYSHEVISHGFWPGGGTVPHAVFYAYAVPEPAGLRRASVRPPPARYDETLSEFILSYDDVRLARSPEQELMAFLESTYDAAADLGAWDRAQLERRR